MTYSHLLPHQLQISLMVPKFLKPPPQPFTPEYDPNMQCKYHVESTEHSIEDCKPFNAKLLKLINKKSITVQGGKIPVNINPLPKRIPRLQEAPLKSVNQTESSSSELIFISVFIIFIFNLIVKVLFSFEFIVFKW